MEPDHEMQFGPLVQPALREGPRPDQREDLAVVAWGQPAEHDLAIYLDLDAVLEMACHARSDRRVELGGVLLGAQRVDEAGRPFVVIASCLRAEHYQATRGSLKFTHETWESITRRRAELSGETEMVGWYHTHPDWGVFLSSMDLFICEHFFNKPLDVAIVLDPVRGQHGIFQWDEREPDRRMRPVSGCWLVSARFRETELRRMAAAWGHELDETAKPTAPSIRSIWRMLKRMGES